MLVSLMMVVVFVTVMALMVVVVFVTVMALMMVVAWSWWWH